ncbi:AsmA-like C-terminal region-containing protein [Aquabacter spiritensis]|uniref:AsmA-like protein n=1 Tax=Aquabacter spiritensis TaxID=933073 RepID=A0A4R3M455_9HYPH|nr:AsmA-like C-terminal region-containing protein [Aquabacter spiritensis]TCT08061.1 AsmA-like protein [Aquabacter spiritensis]
MRRTAIALTAGGAAILAIAALLGVLLVLPQTVEWRRNLAGRVLTAYWGEPVTVHGGADLALWPQARFRFTDLASTTFQGAPVRLGSLDVVLAPWLRLPFDPTVFALRLENGRFEFPLTGDEESAPGTLLDTPVALFSLLPRLRLENVSFVLSDAQDGWEFDLNVSRLLSRLVGNVEDMSSTATLNGTPITLDFKFDRAPAPAEPGLLPFGAVIEFGATGFNGRIKARSPTAGFDRNLVMTMEAHATSIADLLALAGIARSVDGTADLRAQLLAAPNQMELRGLALDIDSSEGERLSLTGGISDLFGLTGVTLRAVLDIDPTAPPAISPRDIAVTRIAGELRDGSDGLMVVDATIDTNAFSQSLRELGPLTIEAIKRDPQGHVALEGITLLAGPEVEPAFRLTGRVGDLLGLSAIALDGTFNIPLKDVVVLPSDTGAQLGRLVGAAAVSDAGGELAFDHLSAELRGSTLISGRIALGSPAAGSDAKKEASDLLDIVLAVPKVDALAAALATTSRFSGPLSANLRLTRPDATARAEGRIDIGGTEIDVRLTSRLRDSRPFVTGTLSSPGIQAEELFLFASGTERPRLAIAGAHLPADGSKLDLPASFDIDIALDAKRIDGVRAAASGLKARLLLHQGAFSADPVTVTLGGGRIEAALTSDLRSQVRAKGSGTGWPLDRLFGRANGFEIAGTAAATFDLSVSLENKAPIVTTLDGHVLARVHDAKLGTGLLDLAGLGVLGGVFNPAVLSGESALRCARIPLRFTHGIGRTDPDIVVETASVMAVARGSVDLAGDRIDLAVVPRPLGAGPQMTGYAFTIKGTLGAPRIALDDGVHPAAARRATSCMSP